MEFFYLISLPFKVIARFLVGVLMVMVGLLLFLHGVKVGFLPAGAHIVRSLGEMDHKLLGIPIEPEKEIVLTAVPRSRTERVLAAIVKGGELDKPGAGIAFVLELKQIEGICHLLMKE